MYKKCEEILNKLESEGKIKMSDYQFPQKQELKLKLKDMLESEVDEKYYLSDEIINKIIFKSNNNFKDNEVNRKYGVFDTDKSKHQAGSVYDENGLSPTLDTMQGGWRQPCIEERGYVEKKYNNFINKNGYIPDMFNPYNNSEIKDIAPTQSTQCGSTTSSATILIKEATKQGYKEAYEGDGVNISSRMKYQRGNVQKQSIQTITTSGGKERGVVVSG